MWQFRRYTFTVSFSPNFCTLISLPLPTIYYQISSFTSPSKGAIATQKTVVGVGKSNAKYIQLNPNLLLKSIFVTENYFAPTCKTCTCCTKFTVVKIGRLLQYKSIFYLLSAPNYFLHYAYYHKVCRRVKVTYGSSFNASALLTTLCLLSAGTNQKQETVIKFLFDIIDIKQALYKSMICTSI